MSTITGYRFGHVLVDDRELTRDVIVLPNRVIENWWRREGHELAWADLQDVADELPGRLVVGTGADQRMRPDRPCSTACGSEVSRSSACRRIARWPASPSWILERPAPRCT